MLLNAAVGEASNANAVVQIGVTDLENFLIFEPRKAEGEFPDYERVLPNKADATISIGLNPNQLLAILRQIAPFADHSQATMVLRVYDANSAIRMDLSNDEGQEWTSVLMPVRLDPADKSEKPDREFFKAADRRGGLKGGRARAAKMTAEQRSESARKEVQARWAKARAKQESTTTDTSTAI